MNSTVSCADVPDIVGQRAGMGEGGVAKLVGEQRRSRFLDHLLLLALHAAVAKSEHMRVTVSVPQDLDLDVAETHDQLLDVEIAVPERRLRLCSHPEKRVVQILR